MRLLSLLFARVRTPVLTFRPDEEASGVAIISAGENATIDYLLDPHLAMTGVAGKRISADVSLSPKSTNVTCHTVIIVRYLQPEWLPRLRQFRAAGGRVIYFMDDDLMDPAATVGLPRAYGRKILRQATRQRRSLEALCDEFWVASPYLADKYRAWSPKLISPRPALALVASMTPVKVCYHGTASHLAELAWLVPVIEGVQTKECASHFEVFGDHSVNRMFRRVLRAAVLHPMSWANYLAYTSAVRRDIALAPLLPNLFNAGRGPTKFFDFTRMGAVGIYTDVAPYRGFIRDGVDGVLLPNDPALWIRTICELAADAPRRQRMACAAQERSLSMVWNRALPLAPEAAPVDLVATNELELLGCQT